MQLIHHIGYIYVNDCKNKINQSMAYANFIHIAFQPIVMLIGCYGLFDHFKIITKNQLIQLKGIIALSAIVSLFQFTRIFKFNNNELKKEASDCRFCGNICSFSGKHHIQFTVPLRTEHLYITPTMFTHFLFFVLPLLLFNNTTRILGIFTFLIGISPTFIYDGISFSESAAIWCFASIFHILVLFCYAKMKQ